MTINLNSKNLAEAILRAFKEGDETTLTFLFLGMLSINSGIESEVCQIIIELDKEHAFDNCSEFNEFLTKIRIHKVTHKC
jgi:hypothetical protein